MTINGINGTNTQMRQMGMNQATDSYIQNIQNQIANVQKQLQELSSNKDMTQEEKAVVNEFEGEKEYQKVMNNKGYYLFDGKILNLIEEKIA